MDDIKITYIKVKTVLTKSNLPSRGIRLIPMSAVHTPANIAMPAL